MEYFETHDHRLYFDGVDLVDLAGRYGTPLYVLSESVIKDRCARIRSEFIETYPGSTAVYASKAFQSLDMCRLIQSEGLGLDVVSGGELYAALKAGFEPGKIVFHGNAKTVEEMDFAVRAGVGRIILDNLYETEQIEKLGAIYGKKVKVLYRVTPGVDSHTHRFISTGSLDSKFGIPLDASVFDDYMRAVISSPHLDFRGFHFHVGSQLFDNFAHLAALKIVLSLIEKVRDEYGLHTEELNVGGGFGIEYVPGDAEPALSYFLAPMMRLLQSELGGKGIDPPRVTIEPGRWIVGPAGITLYTLGAIKEIPGIRTYVGVDGGMTDNIRPALYGAKYHALVANRADSAPDRLVTVAGKCCESGDIVIRDIRLSSPRTGDILAVFATGAYHHSMASNYNRNPRPAVVVVNSGSARISVRRETYEDLVAREE